jgi:hypothetical protein
MRFLEQEAVMTLVTVKPGIPRHVAAARTHRKGAANVLVPCAVGRGFSF